MKDHGEAIRQAAAHGLQARSANYEITVRLQDGSSRVMIDTNPGRWRLGERVKIIDGLAGPGA
jgi:outer membrane lipoprotein SlyB